MGMLEWTWVSAGVVVLLQGIVQIIQNMKHNNKIEKVCEKVATIETTTSILPEYVDKISTKVNDIHAMHNVRNEEGTYVWYNQPSVLKELIIVVKELSKATSEQRLVSEKQIILLDQIADKINRKTT